MAQSYVDYSGNGATTNFVVPFPYLDKSHVHVYLGGSAGTPGAETTAYTWLNATTIQMNSAPPVGTLNVEIRRFTPRDTILVNYSNGSVEYATDFNTSFLQNFYLAQEYYEQPAANIPAGHSIMSHTDTQIGDPETQGVMLMFDSNGKLRGRVPGAEGALLITDPNDSYGARWLANSGNTYDQLEVNTGPAGKLNWVTGFRGLMTGIGDMLYSTAAHVAARLAAGAEGTILTIVSGLPTWSSAGSVAFSTGDAKLTWKTVADSGWIMANDGTIGDATSGATTRANADTLALYTLLWNNTANAQCAVSGGRGANAAADFNAHKTLAIPKQLGRALAISGAGSGLTSRVLALAMGVQDAVLPIHNHTIVDPGHSHGSVLRSDGVSFVTGATQGQAGSTDAATTGITINNAGVSATDGNIQPSSFMNIMVKL